MNNYRLQTGIFTLLFLLLCVACQKEDTALSIEIKSPTFLKENSFILNWTSSATNFDSLYIELSTTNDLNTIHVAKSIVDTKINTYLIDGLVGMTTYYYRISAWRSGKSEFTSAIEKVSTTYTTQNVSFETRDGLLLSGSLRYLDSNKDKRPGILFMHEMGSWLNNWEDSDVLSELVRSGYICMPFFFRGHGTSESISDLNEILNDINLVANDLKAALSFLKSQEMVQADSIGLAGGSLGGIMAIAGNGYDEVKMSVVMSAPNFGYDIIFPDIVPQGVFYIAAENDEVDETNMAECAQNFYAISAEPKKLLIIPNSGKHGTILLETDGVSDAVINWVKENL